MDKITFATNTGPNTLEYTKLLLKSLKENLDSDQHEILVFVDNDNDGTLNYLESIKNNFYDLKIVTHKVKPILGPERNSNLIVELAKHNIVSYLQSDMVVSKHYDTNILKHLKENMILSSTRIEPPLHGPSDLTFTKNFGLSPNEFDWDNFLAYANAMKSDKITDYFFAPFTVYKQTWYRLGGYDTNFRRSRCDTDLVQRALHLGIDVKQTYAANVYHFTCVSSRGTDWFNASNQKAQNRVQLQQLADQIEMRRYIRKWGKFSHIDKVPYKFDIDFVVLGDTPQSCNLAYGLEPFGSRMWVQSQSIKDTLLKQCELEHSYANELYNFTEEDWHNSKHYYNHTNYDKIYCIGEPAHYSVKITLDPNKDIKSFLDHIESLRDILIDSEPGAYKLDDVVINVANIKEVPPSLQVINPKFDNELLEII